MNAIENAPQSYYLLPNMLEINRKCVWYSNIAYDLHKDDIHLSSHTY